MRQILPALFVVFTLSPLGAACDAPEYGTRGPTFQPSEPLTESEHPGWGNPVCTDCHDVTQVHGGEHAVSECATCHGANGAPPLTTEHTGYQQIDCGQCHSPTTHDSTYTFTECGWCHGGNGAPRRPENHWIEDCNDCHADGTLPWDACSHDGLQPYAPTACLSCHW